MNNKTNYLSQFIKKGYLLISLLLTSLALTAIVAVYEFKLLSILRQYNHIFLLALICGLTFGTALLAYLIISVENKQTSTADSIYFTMLFCGIAYLIFIFAGLNYPTRKNLAVAIACLCSGVFFTVVRIAFFNKVNKSEKTAPIKRYFTDLLKKFNFFSIIICSIVLICLAYFLVDYKVINLIIHKKMFIVCSILALPIFLYAIKSLTSASLTFMDVVAVCAIIALPIIATIVYVFSFSMLKFIVLVVAVCLLIAYFLFRFIFYNPDNVKSKTIKTGYVNAILNNFCILEIASIGSILALVSTLLISSDVLHPLYRIKVAIPHVNVLPALVLAISALFTLALFSAVALFGACKKGISLIDYALACAISFILFGFVGLIAHPSIIMLIGLSVFLIFSCLILVVRTKSYI